jgi:lambda family phage minor tail protein L
MSDNALNVELHRLSPTALVDLFVLTVKEYQSNPGGTVYFHNGLNLILSVDTSVNSIPPYTHYGSVVWQGTRYDYVPIEITGMEYSGQGMLPTPTLRVANVGGAVSQALLAYGDLVGAKLTRKRTFARFLDAVNFPGGSNPEASSSMHLPDEIYFVNQKTAETPMMVELKLISALELGNVKLPGRQIIANLCSWEYRQTDCGYTGGYDESGDVLTAWKWSSAISYDPASSDPSKWIAFVEIDSEWVPYRCKLAVHSSTSPQNDPVHWKLEWCAHTLDDCQNHFGGDYAVLPFGSFPGASRISYK